MMELSDYRRGLFQWDTGRSLIVTEKDITEVHFQLLPPPSGSTETTDVPVTNGVAQIPDELLQVGLPLRAYAWGDGYSHYDQTFCVTKREKPTGYAAMPADAITLESVQAKLQAEIDGKIQMPDGGSTGDVLKKTDSGVEWGSTESVIECTLNRSDETSATTMPYMPGDINCFAFPVILSRPIESMARELVTLSKKKLVPIDGEMYTLEIDGISYTLTCRVGDSGLRTLEYISEDRSTAIVIYDYGTRYGSVITMGIWGSSPGFIKFQLKGKFYEVADPGLTVLLEMNDDRTAVKSAVINGISTSNLVEIVLLLFGNPKQEIKDIEMVVYTDDAANWYPVTRLATRVSETGNATSCIIYYQMIVEGKYTPMDIDIMEPLIEES